MIWTGIGLGIVFTVVAIIIVGLISDRFAPTKSRGVDISRRDIDEERLEQCPINQILTPPSISGDAEEIKDPRTHPFWGPILYPEGSHGEINLGELAAHLHDYMRLCDGACEIVSTYARGMSGGYKFYRKEAVAEQIQATIDADRETAIDDFISDHDIHEMKAFIVDIEKALNTPNNNSDWRKSEEGQEFLRRAQGVIPVKPAAMARGGVMPLKHGMVGLVGEKGPEADFPTKIAPNGIEGVCININAKSADEFKMAIGQIEAKGSFTHELTEEECDKLLKMISHIEVPLELMQDLNKFFIDLIHDSDKPDESRSRDLWSRVQKHTQ